AINEPDASVTAAISVLHAHRFANRVRIARPANPASQARTANATFSVSYSDPRPSAMNEKWSAGPSNSTVAYGSHHSRPRMAVWTVSAARATNSMATIAAGSCAYGQKKKTGPATSIAAIAYQRSMSFLARRLHPAWAAASARTLNPAHPASTFSTPPASSRTVDA